MGIWEAPQLWSEHETQGQILISDISSLASEEQ